MESKALNLSFPKWARPFFKVYRYKLKRNVIKPRHNREGIARHTSPLVWGFKRTKGLFCPKRYKVAHGGRGSGKSYGLTDILLIKALSSKLSILCAREYQNSINDSVYSLISRRIEQLGLSPYFTIQSDQIKAFNGSVFKFKGLKVNPESIKSRDGVDICWIEEAQTISQDSLDFLIPTIREPHSEIWFSLNPRMADDPAYKLFIAKPHPEAYVAKVNYTENKHFPAVLEMERRLMLERDPALYNHVWLGECLTATDAQVFKDKWQVQEFTPVLPYTDNEGKRHKGWEYPLYGMDFGFSQDPTACVKVWVHDETLYIEKEAVKVGLEIDDTADYIKSFMPEIEDGIIRADSASPANISYLKRYGLAGIRPCKKWTNFKKEAIKHMRSYKSIVIHPRCTHTINEMMLYSFRVDHRTGDVTPDLIELNDHCQDAIRYAIEPFLKPRYTLEDAFGD